MLTNVSTACIPAAQPIFLNYARQGVQLACKACIRLGVVPWIWLASCQRMAPYLRSIFLFIVI